VKEEGSVEVAVVVEVRAVVLRFVAAVVFPPTEMVCRRLGAEEEAVEAEAVEAEAEEAGGERVY
jgi:hypothetical protein